jgi:MFS family permease
MITYMVIPAVFTGLVLGPGLLAAWIARKKGYRPWYWILAMGPVGLIVILCQPALETADTPEDRERWESRADWTGGVLSVISAFPVFGLAILILFTTVFLMRSVGPVPPPPIAAPTAAVLDTITIQEPDSAEPMTPEAPGTSESSSESTVEPRQPD